MFYCRIYLDNYPNMSIHYRMISKQPAFSGAVRQAGLELAQGDIICYLDHDDFFGRDHLQFINDNFQKDWIYYDDFIITGKDDHGFHAIRRNVTPKFNTIGTSSIAHKKSLNVVWGNGYGHDWYMIERYLFPYPCKKIPRTEYYVCHTPTHDY
jgi:glycosyltransferase involved in cell wall biosynthesis